MQKFIESLFQKTEQKSLIIRDPKPVEAFTANPHNPFLVSFPRTGSHWLRMVMELYFGRPSLARVFYYPRRKNYLTLHKHDMELELVRENVIYLYRDPVDTVYSYLKYEKMNVDDERIAHSSDWYGRHLDRWLHLEKFTKKKTVIRYERLRDTPETEFARICKHLNQKFDFERLKTVMSKVTKEKVKAKTDKDTPDTVNLAQDYDALRQKFREQHSILVWETLLKQREYLKIDFE